ncbi:hypothetical protein [Cerasicoccus fimbriatus]|uniref:hypothetical protein n=1 Tax=Cerasicoccus fimbriatus TaxID=3014554 RepID=UPI0022B3F24D|nr:hypothetical protein [Cerasicoccus sp. TK19100]
MKLYTPLTLIAALAATSLSAEMAQSVSQFGVTWTFEKPYEVGHFANGDWWVVGPVTITDITPKTENNQNGSMINPGLNGAQGFDDRIQRSTYEPALNIATQLPYAVTEPSSILSSISLVPDTTRDNPQMDTIAILTVLNEAPPQGSFRPPYQGTDKSIPGNVSTLDFDKLGKYPSAEYADMPSKLATTFERPYIELNLSWTGRYMHPKNNQPPYGREIAQRLGHGLLALQIDAPDNEKRELLIDLVQVGVDIYGAARLGGKWSADGGHNQGRKLPLILAGVMLQNPDILQYADGEVFTIFQEDQQTFYVTQEDVDRPRKQPRNDGRPRMEPYTVEMIGMPEWGIRHYNEPEKSGSNWNATYRQVSGAPTTTHVLAAKLMGVEEIWNWPAIFDYYTTRYWPAERSENRGVNSPSKFTRAMWEAHVAKADGES